MKATIVAFNSVMKQLSRSCAISTQNFNAAEIRQNKPWGEVLKTLDAPEPLVQETESYWNRWARKRVNESKKVAESAIPASKKSKTILAQETA